MAAPSNRLDEARDALSRYDWGDAFDLLEVEAADCEQADVLELFAESAWWIGRIDDCIAIRQRMFHCAEEHGDVRRAARAAMLLYDNYCFKSQRSVASGWLGRAKRLLVTEPESVEHGNLLIREAEVAHSTGDLESARSFAQQALDLGRRVGHTDLEGDALQCLGRILIALGDAREGLALYDEAMLSATEGRLGPFVSGKIYCSFISACEELGELRRAAEWTDVSSNWAASHPFSAFPDCAGSTAPRCCSCAATGRRRRRKRDTRARNWKGSMSSTPRSGSAKSARCVAGSATSKAPTPRSARRRSSGSGPSRGSPCCASRRARSRWRRR